LGERFERLLVKQEQPSLHQHFLGTLARRLQHEAGAITTDDFHRRVDQVAPMLGDPHVQWNRFAAVPRVHFTHR